MNRPLTPQRLRNCRRGSVYMLVLGMGVLLTVIGLAVATTGRIHVRNAAADRNLTEASALAASAVDLAVATVNSDTQWRSTRGCDAWNAPISLGLGSMTWKQTDENDDDVADNPDERVRLSGEAVAGGAARRFSMVVDPRGTRPLPVLASTLHSETSITVSAALTSSGGAVSCDGLLTNSSKITSDVETGTITNTGSIVGFVTQPSANKEVATVDTLIDYAGRATEISYWSLGSGRIDATILAKSTNPYGPQNASGIYLIRVPSGQTLRVRNSIIQATVIVQLQGTSNMVLEQLVAWEPPAAGMPSLLVYGNSTCTVTSMPDTGTVDVPLLGANLLGIVVVVGSRATAPSEQRGLFHVMGGARTSFQRSPRLIGCWICDGAITVSSATQLIADPNLSLTPPFGYTKVDPTVTAVPGSFRWDSR